MPAADQLAGVFGSPRGHGGLFGQQDDGAGGIQVQAVQARADRPCSARDVAGAIAHARAQVDGLRALRQCGGQPGIGQRRDRGCVRSRHVVRQRGAHALLQHARVPAHLPQPAGHHGRTHAFGVEHDDAGAAHGQVLICGLHQLTARRVLRAGQGARGVFLGAAHIAQEGAARSILQPGLHGAGVNHRHAVAFAQLRRAGGQRRQLVGRDAVVIAAGRAVLQLQVFQVPALRSARR
ncbi:hypothetical protein G6F22_016827 [Rhizopus arrhizus]|nr:hypothetical protein G6F22_016827 [Rhizopus arrhizus]